MSRGILRTYDLCPDGQRIVVQWDKMFVGTSRKGWDIETQVGIIGDRWGVCVWRIL